MVRDLWFRIRSLVRRRTDARELDEELRFHLERQAGVFSERGMPPDEAMRRARAILGSVDAVREASLEARGIQGIETTLQDLRYGVRAMRRTPGFTCVAIVTLALTIGAVSTVLTLVDTFFLKPWPVPHARSLVEVEATRLHGTAPGLVSYADYVAFRDGARSLGDLAAHYSAAPLLVTIRGATTPVNGAVVSANFFSVLGLQPSLGRFFRSEEDRVPSRDRVAVISHALWRARLGASDAALGASIEVNGEPFTVVGVAPPAFRGLASRPSELYIPTMMLSVGYRFCPDAFASDCTILRMVGRVAEDATLDRVRAEMTTLMPARWRTAPADENTGVAAFIARGASRSTARRQLVLLLGLASGLLVLICCANLSGLLMARSGARVRELAIRASLGASRGRLVRQLLTESVALAIAGGACGLLLSLWMTRLIESTFFSTDSQGQPLWFDFSLQPAVAAGVMLLAVVAGILFGGMPALRSAGAGTAEQLKREAAGASARASVSRWLLGAQVALAVTLIGSAAQLAASARTIGEISNVDPSGVALLRARPRLAGYGPQRGQQFLQTIVDRLQASPGVRSASLVGTGAALVGLEAAVSTPTAADRSIVAGYLEVSPRYFEMLGVPLVRGRDFDARDRSGSPPVSIVSRALARRHWPGADAVGATVLVDGTAHQVVGVVEDVPLQSRADPLRPYVYLPFWQNPERVDARVQVRVAGDPAAMMSKLLREAQDIDPAVPITETMTLPAQLRGWFMPVRMGATFVSYAGIVGALVSAIGLYGALAYAVSRRTREIGIRQALGAAPRRIAGLVALEGLQVIAPGVLVGVGLAGLWARVMHHLLYGPTTRDAIILSTAGLLVAGIGVLASWIPARSASRIEPTVALRLE